MSESESQSQSRTYQNGDRLDEALDEALYAEVRERLRGVSTLSEALRLHSRISGSAKSAADLLGYGTSWLSRTMNHPERLELAPEDAEAMRARLVRNVGLMIEARPPLKRCAECGELAHEAFYFHGMAKCRFCLTPARTGESSREPEDARLPDHARTNGPVVTYHAEPPAPPSKPAPARRDYGFGYFSEQLTRLGRVAEEADLALGEREETILALRKELGQAAYEMQVLAKQASQMAERLYLAARPRDSEQSGG